MNTQGERLKLIRKQLGLTQSELGEKLGMSKQYYSKAENNIIVLNNDKLVALGGYFNVNLNYILLGNGEMFIKEHDVVNCKNIGEIIEEAIESKIMKILKVKNFRF